MTFWDGFNAFVDVFQWKSGAYAAGVFAALFVLLALRDICEALMKWVQR